MEFLTRHATGRNILILLALFLLINLVVVPAFYPKFETLDLLSSYSPHDAYQHIASYGAEGRQAYLITELTIDLLYPAVLALLFSLLTIYLFQRGFPQHPRLRILAWLPFVVMLADYLENACVIIMLTNYPKLFPELAAVSNVFTVIKASLSWPELVIVLIGAAAWLLQALRGRSLRSAHA